VNIIQNTTIVQIIGAPELLESAERQVERLTFEGEQHAIEIYGAVMVVFFIHLVPADAPRRVPRAPADVGSLHQHDKPEITEIVNAQMPLGATLGIRMFGGADEVDATIDWAPGSAPLPVCSTVACSCPWPTPRAACARS
jgi:hypothetical protein